MSPRFCQGREETEEEWSSHMLRYITSPNAEAVSFSCIMDRAHEVFVFWNERFLSVPILAQGILGCGCMRLNELWWPYALPRSQGRLLVGWFHVHLILVVACVCVCFMSAFGLDLHEQYIHLGFVFVWLEPVFRDLAGVGLCFCFGNVCADLKLDQLTMI